MKYPSTPEVIATVTGLNKYGEETNYGDVITGISVAIESASRDGEVTIDLRDVFKNESLIIRLQLPELMAALTSAILHSERPSTAA